MSKMLLTVIDFFCKGPKVSAETVLCIYHFAIVDCWLVSGGSELATHVVRNVQKRL